MKYTKFLPRVRSKNHSCNGLRHRYKSLGYYPFKSIIRFGSLTPTKKVFPKSYENAIEINRVDAIETSRNKLSMKEAFARAGVPQSRWFKIDSQNLSILTENQDITGLVADITLERLPYPILAKRIYGFKGKGMVKLNSKEELEEFIKGTNLSGYYFEQFHNYSREYRLHCTKDGCFYGLRKMLKNEIEEDKRWYRNDSNCVWITEFCTKKDGDNISYEEGVDNPLFDKPVNWKQIEQDCVKALKEVGLDTGAFDIKIQSALNSGGDERKDPKYIIIEVNSAPSMGEITSLKYKTILRELLIEKYEATI